MLKRDFRAGELRLLGLALVIAVASLSSVSFFSDRLSRALAREAHQLLGGDLLLLADHPWAGAYRAEAQRLGLRVVGSVGFPSMTSANGASHLADIKAVEPGYPLRGALRTAPALNQPDAETRETPARGTVWLDERLASALAARGQAATGMPCLTSRAAVSSGCIRLSPGAPPGWISSPEGRPAKRKN